MTTAALIVRCDPTPVPGFCHSAWIGQIIDGTAKSDAIVACLHYVLNHVELQNWPRLRFALEQLTRFIWSTLPSGPKQGRRECWGNYIIGVSPIDICALDDMNEVREGICFQSSGGIGKFNSLTSLQGYSFQLLWSITVKMSTDNKLIWNPCVVLILFNKTIFLLKMSLSSEVNRCTVYRYSVLN